MESVLGATPQEFESPILRRAELRKCAVHALQDGALVGAVASILISAARLAAPAANRLAPTLCLVTAAADGAGFELGEVVPMPANNFVLVLRRRTGGD